MKWAWQIGTEPFGLLGPGPDLNKSENSKHFKHLCKKKKLKIQPSTTQSSQQTSQLGEGWIFKCLRFLSFFFEQTSKVFFFFKLETILKHLKIQPSPGWLAGLGWAGLDC